ncbi:hypothetical protein UM93_06010 [Psychromicrobium lacuslunae]|uniref:Uncharacterized protein n=1 Tax=Psychromicrobium lacuslunae TaxID=1618207 RepID=A0A0D4BYK3_9MICC|nr:hypothetical protein UM93_06010 [Psychromicrobium lacuslunae]
MAHFDEAAFAGDAIAPLTPTSNARVASTAKILLFMSMSFQNTDEWIFVQPRQTGPDIKRK